MESFRPENFEAIANDMGISLHQRFSVNEASLFLRCPLQELQDLITEKNNHCFCVAPKPM